MSDQLELPDPDSPHLDLTEAQDAREFIGAMLSETAFPSEDTAAHDLLMAEFNTAMEHIYPEEICPRCGHGLHWVQSSWQCPKCKYKEGCCG